VIPDLLHVVPVVDDTVLDGVGYLENSSLLLGLISKILVLCLNPDDDTWVLGSPNDGGEDGSGGVFA
jgi:hypothetical protein